MTSDSAPQRTAPRAIDLPVWLFQAVVVVLIVAKVAHAAVTPPNEDEAYYWLWGQHLELSYFDHAPLVGWTMWLSNLLFGWSLLSLRAGNFVALFVTALLLWRWAGYFAPNDRARWFWASLATYLASPLIFAVSSLAYPDTWLMMFGLLSAHFFACAFAKQIDEGRTRPADLYLGGLFLGLAALAKYNAVLLGLGVAFAVLLTPRLRPLLRNPHLYLAALLSVAVLFPILYWNATHDFISLRFQLYERHGSGWLERVNWYEFIRFCILFAISLSPFLLVPFVAVVVRRAGSGIVGALHILGRWGLVLALTPIFTISLFVAGAPHWAVIGLLVPIAIAVQFFVSRWLVLAHLAYGTLLATVLAAYYMSFAFVNFGGDGEASRFYGWDQVGTRMQELAAEHGAVTIAGINYGGISKIAFAIKSTNLTSLSSLTDEFDFWRDEDALAGQDIILVDEYGGSGDRFEPSFESVQLLETFDIVLHGRQLRSHQILLGRGYRPPERRLTP